MFKCFCAAAATITGSSSLSIVHADSLSLLVEQIAVEV